MFSPGRSAIRNELPIHDSVRFEEFRWGWANHKTGDPIILRFFVPRGMPDLHT